MENVTVDRLAEILDAKKVEWGNEWQAKWEQDLNNAMTEMQKLLETKQSGSRPREGLTMKRAFSQLPSYNGKIEDYDDWSFQVRRFLSEEKDFKEMMFKLKKMTSAPDRKYRKCLKKWMMESLAWTNGLILIGSTISFSSSCA